MKRAVLKVMTVFFIFTFLSGYASPSILAQTKGSDLFSGRIIYVDQARGFAIIDLGKEDGVKKGCFFDVYRRNIKIGKIKTIKIRRRFAACDIECTYKNRFMKVGDRVQLSKKAAAVFEHKEEELLRNKLSELFAQTQNFLKNKKYEQAEDKINEILQLEPGNKRALEMLDRIAQACLREKLNELFIQAQEYLKEMEYELAEEKIREILQLEPKNKKALKMLRKVEKAIRVIIGLEPEIIVVYINAPKHIIHSTAMDVLRKYGCQISSSDPVKYNLQASKNIKLPLAMGFFTEWGPSTRNKIYYTVEIRESPKSEDLIINRLIICLRGVYDKEGQVYNHEIKKSSPAYKEAEEMALKIKYLIENL